MNPQTFSLEFITPCFCAGANQAKAEIRAPAVRGQLRWWFRALAGSRADEQVAFGGVGASASASALVVRFRLLENTARSWTLPEFTANDVESYVYYFVRASGATGRGAYGPRWQQSAAFGPRTQALLQLVQLRSLAEPVQRQLDTAIDCFLRFGSLGLRATRGLGAFHCRERPFSKQALESLRAHGFRTELRSGLFDDDKQVAQEIGSLVKGTRKEHRWNADKVSSPLGRSSVRQTSAIWFRPVRAPDGRKLQLAVLEAPHDRVLGRDSRNGKPPIIGTVNGLVRFTPPPRRR